MKKIFALLLVAAAAISMVFAGGAAEEENSALPEYKDTGVAASPDNCKHQIRETKNVRLTSPSAYFFNS